MTPTYVTLPEGGVCGLKKALPILEHRYPTNYKLFGQLDLPNDFITPLIGISGGFSQLKFSPFETESEALYLSQLGFILPKALWREREASVKNGARSFGADSLRLLAMPDYATALTMLQHVITVHDEAPAGTPFHLTFSDGRIVVNNIYVDYFIRECSIQTMTLPALGGRYSCVTKSGYVLSIGCSTSDGAKLAAEVRLREILDFKLHQWMVEQINKPLHELLASFRYRRIEPDHAKAYTSTF